ncbi:MAG: gamma-glutamyltransferase [Acidobacteria bacterium]|nr:gamma-glutamyltransferase [Acidobacteriota bacterium]
MARRGMVATSHPAATLAGLDMLRAGGSAIDGAVAAAAMLAVVEPMMTGIGGDAFLLYYLADPDGGRGELLGLNGSGRSPLALERTHIAGPAIDPDSWPAVTVPGAVDLWQTAHQRFGRLRFADLLGPAIETAEAGFPVSERVQSMWTACTERLRRDPAATEHYLLDGEAPALGAVFRSHALARSLRQIAQDGRDAFYEGPIAEEIVRYARDTGGFLQLEDFRRHRSTWVDPIGTLYRGREVFQLPPNGQGLGVLLMLNLLENFDLGSMDLAGPRHTHLLVEAKKLAYADLHAHVGDPENEPLRGSGGVPLAELLDKAYARERCRLIDPGRPADGPAPGGIPTGGAAVGSDTVYLAVVDGDGNAASFINSLFAPFGAAIAGGDTGIMLHCRGAGFSLAAGHPNEYRPGKRPFHTIIPGMVLERGRLELSYGVMGGPFQPQGHVQLLTNHYDHGLSLQAAIDRPRWRHTAGLDVLCERGMEAATVEGLVALGHQVRLAGGAEFGGAQAIGIDRHGTLFGASDPRKDGAALGY